MKRIFFSLISAALILAGCAKEQAAPVGEGDLTTVMFTANLENGTSTKAANDGDGQAANVNRCIMEVYYDGSLFGRQVTPVTDKKASFTMQVVSNRTYTVAFWADCVTAAGATPTAAELAEDLYYTTNAAQPNGGLQAIAMKGTYAGNKDSRDAFYAVDTYTIAQGGTQCNATLKRPFAQINVITTDWDKVSSIDALKPTNVDVTIKNPYTVFNAVTQEASTTVSSIKYNATVYSPAATGAEKTLSMDYLFASNEKEMIDIDFKAQKSGNDDVSHTFTAVPYQRNYRTNIKGALLTTTGQWNVTVDPIWATGDIPYEVVNDIADANEVIQNAIDNGKNEINVKFTSQPSDAGKPGDTPNQDQTKADVTVGGNQCRAILTTGLKEGMVLNILIEARTKDLYIGDYASETSTALSTSETKAAVVNVNVPAGSSIQKLVVNAPSKTVYLNGLKVAAGEITAVDASTSDNTLIIEDGQTVGTLTLRQGAVKIHGTVGAAVVDLAQGKNLYVRDCEGLSQSVYNKLEPYIDINNGYSSVQKGDKWDIVKGVIPVVATIGEKNYYFLQTAFNEVADGQTIVLAIDLTQTTGVLFNNNVAATFDLNHKTFKVTDDTANSHRAIKVTAGTLNVKNGTVDARNVNAQGEPTSIVAGNFNGIYGAFRAEDGTSLNLKDVTVYNNHFFGLSSKYSTGSAGEIDGCTFYSNYGGAVEVAGGVVTVKNSTVHQEGVSTDDDYDFIACGIGTSANGTANVDNCQVEAYFPLVEMPSGGVINIDGGTYSTNAQNGSVAFLYETYVEENHNYLNIFSGNFSGKLTTHYVDAYRNYHIIISGGTYTVDPSTYVADGYKAVANGTTPETWTVKATTPTTGTTTGFGDWK